MALTEQVSPPEQSMPPSVTPEPASTASPEIAAEPAAMLSTEHRGQGVDRPRSGAALPFFSDRRRDVERLTHTDLLQVLSDFRQIDKQLARLCGLTVSEFHALRYIALAADSNGPLLSAGDLTEQLHVSPAAISHVTDGLVAAGLIHRVGDPTDRRRLLLRLSNDGVTAIRRVEVRFARHCRSELTELSDDDLDSARRVLAALTRARASYLADLGP